MTETDRTVGFGDAQVRGSASPEELAALFAALRGRERENPHDARQQSSYERWRASRLRALRKS